MPVSSYALTGIFYFKSTIMKIKFRQPVGKKGEHFSRFHYWGFIMGASVGPETNICSIEEAEQNSQQSLGIKDVQGKEVYEGDIIQSMKSVKKDEKPKQSVVVWDQKRCMFTTKERIFEDFPIDFQVRYNQLYQVIGNIHQNPELL